VGLGVKVDRVQAGKWLTLAAAQGQRDSVQKLAELRLSSSELAQVVSLVHAFVPRARAAG